MDVLLQGGEILTLKKCGFLLVFAMMFCFVIPNFASAEVIKKTDSYTKWYIKGYSPETTFKGKEEGTSYLYSTEVIADLGAEYNVKYVDYYAQGGVDGGYIRFYDVNFRFVSNFDLKSYGYKGKINIGTKARYVSVGHSTRQSPNSMNVSRLDVYIDDGAVSNVLDLKATPEMNKITLNWKNPDGEENFKGLRIYQGNQIIANLDNKTTSYVVNGLDASKGYSFTVKSIDQNGGETKGTSVNATTLMPVIKPPKNVFLTPQDKKIVIAWDDVNSPYLQGYNVYVDGKKINDKPLTSSKLIVKNLENDKSYKVQVSAVNKNNVEGEKSKEVAEKPSSDALEVEYEVKMPFNPKDVIGVAMVFLLIVGPLILLGLAFRFYKPIITFLYNSIQNKKGRDKK
ncbi:fibronectin type III domain-containing protein [Bacillus toyonensis]|uniref:fibronectin type III domain-containing protein n=1 Tax=Bacillus toyonensis TaxID=155322 RepID=UPI003467D578